MRVALPFSTVVMECALAPATSLPPVQPPRTRMVSESMGTTATQCLGLDNDDTEFHLLVDSSNMATSEVLEIITTHDHWWVRVWYCYSIIVRGPG